MKPGKYMMNSLITATQHKLGFKIGGGIKAGVVVVLSLAVAVQ